MLIDQDIMRSTKQIRARVIDSVPVIDGRELHERVLCDIFRIRGPRTEVPLDVMVQLVPVTSVERIYPGISPGQCGQVITYCHLANRSAERHAAREYHS